jgi:hypothetical protein
MSRSHRRRAETRSRPRRAAAWLALVLLATGCAVTTPPSVVRVNVDRPVPPPIPSDASDAKVLATVSWVLTQRLGLPLTLPIRVHFYSSPESFEHGLVNEAGADTWLAKDQARFATGVGTAEGIFIRSDRLVSAPLGVRVGLFAHELTHISQYGLAAGRRAGSEQWLREGFADWVRYQTLDLLGFRPYAESRRRVLDEVRRGPSVEQLPALGMLVTNRQWIRARNDLGGPATYGQAFLATDWLVDRYGSARVVEYFRRFGHVDDRSRNFLSVFGTPAGQFAQEFRSRLPSLL